MTVDTFGFLAHHTSASCRGRVGRRRGVLGGAARHRSAPVPSTSHTHLRHGAVQLRGDGLQPVHDLQPVRLLHEMLVLQELRDAGGRGRGRGRGIGRSLGGAAARQPWRQSAVGACPSKQSSPGSCGLLPLALYRSIVMREPSGITPPLYLPAHRQAYVAGVRQVSSMHCSWGLAHTAAMPRPACACNSPRPPARLPVSTPDARGLQVVSPRPCLSYSGAYSSCAWGPPGARAEAGPGCTGAGRSGQAWLPGSSSSAVGLCEGVCQGGPGLPLPTSTRFLWNRLYWGCSMAARKRRRLLRRLISLQHRLHFTGVRQGTPQTARRADDAGASPCGCHTPPPGPMRSSLSATRHASAIWSALHSEVPQ